MSKVINMKDLKKVEGISIEEVAAKLKEESPEIIWDVCETKQGHKFFRDTTILFKGHSWIPEEILGKPDRRYSTNLTDRFSYYALYELTPNFDTAQLDRSYTFKKGKLVERTVIEQLWP